MEILEMQSTKVWYQDWFNSRYYHILYSNRDEKEASGFIERLLTYLEPQPDAYILDVACGRGRHSVSLNKKGYTVVGIDLSPDNIRYASGFENEKLSFYIHDMRHLFRVNYFDYIFNIFTSFGYFESERENVNTIKAFASGLKKGGKLIIDFLNSEKVIRNLVPEENKTIKGIRFNIRRYYEDPFIVKKIEVIDNGNRYEFAEKVKALSLQDFERYMEIAQLDIVDIFGDYHLNPYAEEQSDRLIIIAQKKV